MLIQVCVMMMAFNQSYTYYFETARDEPTQEEEYWADIDYMRKWYRVKGPAYPPGTWFRWGRSAASLPNSPGDPNVPAILPCEVEWLSDLNMLSTFFTEWRQEREEPYATVIFENWGRTSGRRDYAKEIDGVLYPWWIAPHSWWGDLFPDGVVNMHDYGIMSENHTRSFYVPEPEPQKSNVELIAELMAIVWVKEQEE